MVRFLIWWAVFVGLSWLLKQSWRNRPQRSIPGRRMVRDRICDTFLPQDRALYVKDRAGLHHFCSQNCRERYLHHRTGEDGPAARSAPAD